jgi:hypothetical protein
MAHETASISFYVSFDSDVEGLPCDEELLSAYQDLKDFVADHEILSAGVHYVDFHIGEEAGGDE